MDIFKFIEDLNARNKFTDDLNARNPAIEFYYDTKALQNAQKT